MGPQIVRNYYKEIVNQKLVPKVHAKNYEPLQFVYYPFLAVYYIFSSIPFSFNLSSVTQNFEPHFKNDVICTCRMIEQLLSYESKRSGFDLSAATEESYTGKYSMLVTLKQV